MSVADANFSPNALQAKAEASVGAESVEEFFGVWSSLTDAEQKNLVANCFKDELALLSAA